MKRIIDKALLLLFCVLTMFVTACKDELLYNPNEKPQEGLPATVTFKVNVGNEIKGTRYAGFIPGEEPTSRIGHLWIGIFNVGTGNKITQLELQESEIKDNHDINGTIKIEDFPLSSGACYIVAVANSDSNQGVIIDDSGSRENSKDNLLSILRKIEKWEDFKKVSFLLLNPESVSRVSGNFIMCGTYYEGEMSHSREAFWDEDGNPHPVYIFPNNNDLSGAIHLQRLDSYVKFVLQAGENVKITPVSWQVKNLPGVSFLYERKGSCTINQDNVINAADTKKNGTLWPNYGSFNKFYNDSQVYLANTFNKDRNEDYSLTGTYSFDFYQLENKHKGIITSDSSTDVNNPYNEREREFKNESGENTGWYSSLVEGAGTETPTDEKDYRNNNASFVEIRVQVEYYYEEGDPTFTPVAYDPNSEDSDSDIPNSEDSNSNNPDSKKKFIHRVANAVYTVHLGYVKYEDAQQPDVNDFNCFRNTSTTYTITISGADKIRVEAVGKDKEEESGAEGTVTDIEENMINMDCHYGVFNIKLSDKARENLIWRIRAPYGEQYIDMASGASLENYSSPNIINLSDGKHTEEVNALPYNQFYNWVQIVPTTGPNVVAKYPGDRRLINRDKLPKGYEKSSIKTPDNVTHELDDVCVWYLEELRNPKGFKHPLKQDNSTDDDEFYYTVFIDEYVYEHEYDREAKSMTKNKIVYDNWKDYANRDYRKLWIRLGNPEISNDGESIYSKSQYMLTQESIQTFYNDQATSCFGIEHINETYTGDPYSIEPKGYNSQNGRQNLQSFRNDYFGEKYNKNLEDLFKNEFQTGKNAREPNDNKDVTYYINKHEHDYMVGALARNRDLNNNGIIDDFEIRWYLPVVQTYTRIQLGAVSLKTPLFNLLDYAPNEITPNVGTVYSHYAASNDSKLWAEELISTGEIQNYGASPGTMRCIRNLGENPGDEIKDKNSVLTAYEYDPKTRVVTMKYYRAAALRPETEHHIPTHYTGEILSYPARRFKVAKRNLTPEDVPEIQDKFFEGGIDVSYRNEDIPIRDNMLIWEKWVDDNTLGKTYSEEPDGSDKGSWRMPNVNELAIMNFLGDILYEKSYISCTQEYFEGRGHFFLGRNSSGAVTAKFSPPFYVILVKDVIE